MFSGIRLTNLKRYRDTGWIPLRPLTLLVGPNNVGKSTVLESLLLLAQTWRDSDRNDPLVTTGPDVDMGSFWDILRGGKGSPVQEFGINLRLSEAYVGEYGQIPEANGERPFEADPPSELRLTFGLNEKTNEIFVSKFWIGPGGTQRAYVRVDSSDGKQGSWHFPGVGDHLTPYLRPGWRHFFATANAVLDQIQSLEPPQNFERLSEVMTEAIRLQYFASVWGGAFRDVRYVPPLRAPIPRYTVLGRMPPTELSRGGENLLRVFQNTASVRDEGKSLLELTEMWMKERGFNFLDSLSLVNVDPGGTVRSLTGKGKSSSLEINVANMGEGISQLLPTIASVSLTGPGQCLVVEQPEIHLHPSAQADIADLLIGNLRDDSAQFIVETHSEHMLLRLRRRVAEGRIRPDQVAVLFVEPTRTQSRVTHLDLDESGHFERWPKEFFDQGYQEALKLAEAASRRRGKNGRPRR